MKEMSNHGLKMRRQQEWNMNTCLRAWLVMLLGLSLLSIAKSRAEIYDPGQYANLPGVKLWFIDTCGSGVPIVLLHANTGTIAYWENQITKFSHAGYRVVAFDRRGWGKSTADPATGSQPRSIAEDLEGLADYLKIDRFHLVGVAGGGFAALDYAGWRSHRLRSLVIAASTGKLVEKEIEEFTRRIEIPELRKLPAVYREVGASYRGANPDGTKRWIEIDAHAQQPGATEQLLRTPNTLAKLEAIAAPTLIIAADADLLAPPALTRLWAEHVKGHEWAIVPDSGHAIAWEQPDAFDEKVIAFVRRH
jgi:pimeloyl-ACP methyl ester carboxylesterase